MIPRILEPEVMDTAEEAREYDAMDHGEVNARFAVDFLQALADQRLAPDSRVLDVGTGTALIPIEIASRSPGLHITAIDLSEEMLKLGRRNVAQAGLSDRITLKFTDARACAESSGGFDAVVSNSLIHHIPDPNDVFQALWKSCRGEGVIFIRDLLRPASKEELDRLVLTYAGDADPHQKQLFAESLHAALTLAEVKELLGKVEAPATAVAQTSDRHWTVCWVKPG